MFTSLYETTAPPKKPEHKEGELYKIINTYGKTFHIYYGYYEDSDRYSKYPEPVEVFPNFIKDPLYTENGCPFVTAIQEPCDSFKKVRDVNDCCGDCKYYEQGEELIGICACPRNRKNGEVSNN